MACDVVFIVFGFHAHVIQFRPRLLHQRQFPEGLGKLREVAIDVIDILIQQCLGQLFALFMQLWPAGMSRTQTCMRKLLWSTCPRLSRNGIGCRSLHPSSRGRRARRGWSLPDATRVVWFGAILTVLSLSNQCTCTWLGLNASPHQQQQSGGELETCSTKGPAAPTLVVEGLSLLPGQGLLRVERASEYQDCSAVFK